MEIEKIQPSQLYISSLKLKKVQESHNPSNLILEIPIPIKNLNGRIIFVDGHTRAVALYLLNRKTIAVYWEYEDLDWIAYDICVQWCIKEKIYSVSDLTRRIVSHEEYERLWYQRCDELNSRLESERKNLKIPS